MSAPPPSTLSEPMLFLIRLPAKVSVFIIRVVAVVLVIGQSKRTDLCMCVWVGGWLNTKPKACFVSRLYKNGVTP